MAGAFSKFFRTGAEQGTSTEVIGDDLNASMGTAYNPEPGTVIWFENHAIARALSDWFDTVERLKNQSLPKRMTVSIPRWETLLGIHPATGATDDERRKAIEAKLKLFNVVPTDQATKDYLNRIIPDLFVELIRTASPVAIGSYPGGLVITGGVNLPDGPFQSQVCTIVIRVHQPLNMSDQEYYAKVGSYREALESFLPAHVLFKHGRFTYSPPGTITVAAGSDVVTGSGTVFTNDPSGIVLQPNGGEMETFDDNGKLTRLFIEEVLSDTSIKLLTPVATNITARKFRVKGYVLGYTNLGNAFLT